MISMALRIQLRKSPRTKEVTKLDLSKQLDLEVEMEADDVTELLTSHGEELSAEDLIQLEKQMMEEEEEAPAPESERFTSKGLADGFALREEGLAKFEAEDPNLDRYTKVARGAMDCLRGYREIWGGEEEGILPA